MYSTTFHNRITQIAALDLAYRHIIADLDPQALDSWFSFRPLHGDSLYNPNSLSPTPSSAPYPPKLARMPSPRCSPPTPTHTQLEALRTVATATQPPSPAPADSRLESGSLSRSTLRSLPIPAFLLVTEGYDSSAGRGDRSMRNKGEISLRISGRHCSRRNVSRSSCLGCPKTMR